MKFGKLSTLAAALAAGLLVTACNRADDTTGTAYENEPATTDQPATDTTSPASTTAGTNTAATDTTSATGTGPATTSPITGTEPTTPPTTTADATTSFDDMDINNDGSLSQDELPDMHPLRQGFTTADSDSNGALSRSEVEAQRSRVTPPGG